MNDAKQKHFISLVIPLLNEAESLVPLYAAIQEALRDFSHPYEIIFVDDGSSDGSFHILQQMAEKEERIRVLRLAKNFGQTAAIAAGIDAAKGDVVVTLDADLQNDPKDIPMLVAKLDEGYDVVSGWRKKRNDTFINRKLPSFIANAIISLVTGAKLHDYGCTLKAYRHQTLEAVQLYGEMHRFVPALVYGAGGKIVEVEVRHHARKFGKTKYGIERTFKVILDLLVIKFLNRYFTRPMHFFGGVGLWSFGAGLIIFFWMAVLKIVEHTAFISTPLPLVAVFFFLVGLQFILMGLLAEMMIRVYFESGERKTYRIKERIR